MLNLQNLKFSNAKCRKFSWIVLLQCICLLINFWITLLGMFNSHVEQDLLTLPEYLRSPLVFGGVRVVYSLVFYVVLCVLLFICLPFSFLDMALSVYCRFMSLTVPLVFFVPLLKQDKVNLPWIQKVQNSSLVKHAKL